MKLTAFDLVSLYEGDCREVMRTLKRNSVDAIVTDPPYEFGFMGKSWDASGIAYDPEVWKLALRALKPGGHLLAFGGPRTYHRLAVAIEDAGFGIRDSLMWLFGSGFPKSLDVSKALDKAAGVAFAARPASGVGFMNAEGAGGYNVTKNQLHRIGESTDLAREWEGWGTALKPAYEPIVLARKSLQGTVAGNVARWGTGGLNIDATRIEGEPWSFKHSPATSRSAGIMGAVSAAREGTQESNPRGRWPANVLLDTEAARLLDAMSGDVGGGFGKRGALNGGATKWGFDGHGQDVGYGDSGGASRFFYTAKASREEREFGLKMLEPKRRSDGRQKDIENPRLRTNERRNDHPTVKPVDLMRWLVRLVTPPDGVVFDPFMGSGSTGVAAVLEHKRFIGVDLDYLKISESRIRAAIKKRDLGEVQETLEGEVHYKGCRFPAMACICEQIRERKKRGK